MLWIMGLQVCYACGSGGYAWRILAAPLNRAFTHALTAVANVCVALVVPAGHNLNTEIHSWFTF